jgi:hypothetical protein
MVPGASRRTLPEALTPTVARVRQFSSDGVSHGLARWNNPAGESRHAIPRKGIVSRTIARYRGLHTWAIGISPGRASETLYPKQSVRRVVVAGDVRRRITNRHHGDGKAIEGVDSG